ncbi:1-deoxy-D-xylulose-5-phosphate reductoisomerase [Paremcibacter congregatus]|uniref:1-deoxy-D-xylulose 5-phosphate reductoisomerase n=1 Tax=Paremcibacter congregatus TaxID=2043170 RepID=A0A2G4YSP0_9PROT|nr:1-deoxy-D-xylulose-5-phosphate reductoisomerase [Paremcibacter congregatus]PHZ85345.1 1-deoxy-D-xylulose-5-phosphate reductoisomerase [Paremcibacter congregatus]QDE27724.1 1-deoxy-D-xylulose-5-phosphate reductoisomerase [Paremcibacter congregatus]
MKVSSDQAGRVCEPKTVTILGSTGSVGCNTLDLIAQDPQAYDVVALTAHKNVDLLGRQAREFNARSAVIGDESCYGQLKEALAGTDIAVSAGQGALDEAAHLPAEWVMASIVGAAGLRPTLSAVRRGATVALANKECLVCAGDLMMQEVEAHAATLLPVDSEHNAIFQVFDFDRAAGVDSITLTASGGPFINRSLEDMRHVTPAEAVAHPNWDMGAKISVDSATMMNKGLEMIEAYHLFPVTESQIEVVVHPQSVIHSMVTYRDGSVLAQLGSPDMRIPISYALGWPNRLTTPAKKLNLAELGRLDFEEPDEERFPALRLTREALRLGGTAPTILNAANEIAVGAFLQGRLGFLDIARVVEESLDKYDVVPLTCLNMVQEVDQDARRLAARIIEDI